MTESLAPNNAPVEPRVRHSAKERRHEVVQAVLELACERGPEAVTTQAIADHIGLTHGALFRHFPDKAAIWTAVFEWVQVQLGAVIDAAFDAGGPSLEILERLFISHVRFVARHPGVPRVLFHELQAAVESPLRKRARLLIGNYRRRLAALISEAKLQGALPSRLDEEAAAILFVGAVQGLALQSVAFRGEAGMLDAARRIFPLLLDGYRGASA